MLYRGATLEELEEEENMEDACYMKEIEAKVRNQFGTIFNKTDLDKGHNPDN